jgi:hypothetical protein
MAAKGNKKNLLAIVTGEPKDGKEVFKGAVAPVRAGYIPSFLGLLLNQPGRPRKE